MHFTTKKLIAALLQTIKPLETLSTREWAETYRWLTADVTSRPGKMDCGRTPWMLYPMECMDDPKIRIIVAKKSAQISWTETVNNFIGRIIHQDPKPMMILFPRQKSAIAFYNEKLKVFLERTEVLKGLVGNLTKVSREHIPFPGGFIKLVTAASAEAMKSSVIPILIVEEPSGVKDNVDNQGDGFEVMKQRFKSFPDYKLIYGGTPVSLSLCQVTKAYNQSNKLVYMTPCHLCGNFHELNFEYLKADTWEDNRIDDIYGIYNPLTAYYMCPHCLGRWTFEEKNQNVHNAINFNLKGWVPTSESEVTDIYGFSFNELLSNFENSSFINLMKTKLKAEVEYDKGKDGPLTSFYNNSMGMAFSPVARGLTEELLVSKRLNYKEKIVPYQGLVLTAGIDVQHNRFAIVVRAWGRGENSWLVHWTEIFGNPTDWGDKIWNDLEQYLKQDFLHEAGNGVKLKIARASIDSSDGNTAQNVYNFVNYINDQRIFLQVLAVKGTDNYNENIEIYNEPLELISNSQSSEVKTLAASNGVIIYQMGSHMAHEEVLRKYSTNGTIDRYFHCETSYSGYESQILSCIKKIKLRANGVSYYSFVKLPSKNKEGIDCEKMALHAAYSLKIRSFREENWAALENYLHSQVN